MTTISADDPFESVAPTAEPIPDDSVELEVDYNIIMNAPEEVEVDLEDVRDNSHDLVGCKIRACYDDQCVWILGKITWYNTKTGKLRVYYEEDNSDDYITAEDINGVNMIMDFIECHS